MTIDEVIKRHHGNGCEQSINSGSGTGYGNGWGCRDGNVSCY